MVARIAAGPTLPKVDERVGLMISRTGYHLFDPDGNRIEARPVESAPLRSVRAFPVGERVSQ